MKIKTNQLAGPALDWAVAIAFNPGHEWGEWQPSIDWAQGGPIIQEEQITLRFSGNDWIAEWWADNSGMAKNPAQRFRPNAYKVGPTPLIAAMRCYVESKFGDEVDAPDELVSNTMKV